MRYLLILMILVFSSFVFASEDVRKVTYECPFDTVIDVFYSTDGQSATMHDSANRVFELQREPSASGVLFRGPTGAAVHSKGDMAFIELVAGRPMECTKFKGN